MDGITHDNGINVPAARLLIRLIKPGYRVIYRSAFRWLDEYGHVMSNHYECQDAPYLAVEHGHDLVLDLGYAAILVDKRPYEND